MLKLIICAAALMACTAASAQDVQYQCLDVPVEIRGIWIDAGAIPKTEEGIRELVRSYHRANLNVLFPEVVARGYTVYPSKLIDRDPRFAGAIDPLPIIIDEAHSLGMEVHPWVWVFRAGYTKDKGAILTRNPGWVELSKEGKELSPNGGYWISPVVPEAQDFLVNLYSELVANYDVDGLHLDYIRYEVEDRIPYGYSPQSRAKFEQQYGIDPIDIDRLSFHQIEWNKFRERHVNTLVHRTALQMRAIKPDIKVSAAVGSDPKTARLNLMQNWVHWVDNKWVDFLTPMAYSSSDQHFRGLVGLEQAAVRGRSLVAPGVGIYVFKEPQQMVSQAGLTRELMAAGQTLFASSYFTDEHASLLMGGPYASAATLPFRDPLAKSVRLCEHAKALRNQERTDEADHILLYATTIAEYAGYMAADIPFMHPTPPPLVIPENVVPLPVVEIPVAARPVNVDGNLRDEAWRSAAMVQLAYTNQGDPAPVQTTAFITRDDANLYIGFRCVELFTGKIRAEVTERDGPVFYDDSVEVFFAPTDNRLMYYHLATNTLGARFDQKGMDPAWNGNWTAAANVGLGMWTAEIAIPFAMLEQEPPRTGSRWTLNLTRTRTVTGTSEYTTWAVPYGGFHTADRFGKAVFQ